VCGLALREHNEQQYEGLSRLASGLGIGLVTWLVLFLLQLGSDSPIASYLEQLEHQALDLRFSVRADIAPTIADDRILIVMVDQEAVDFLEHRSVFDESLSINDDEPWPWKREKYGQIAEFLTAMGAESVFFDFLWTGRSVYDWDGYEDDDTNCAAKCLAAGNVFMPLHFDQLVRSGAESPAIGQASAHDTIANALIERTSREKLNNAVVSGGATLAPLYQHVQVPIRPLADAAKGLGAVNEIQDADGINRRVGLLYGFEDQSYCSIHLALARHHLDAAAPTWNQSAEHVAIGDVEIPVDEQGRMLVNWRSIHEEFNTSYVTRSFHKILIDAINWEAGAATANGRLEFQDKIVLIGTSAAGMSDLRATPLNSKTPGIEVHATALDNILNRDFIQQPDRVTQNVLSLALFVLAGVLFVRKQSVGRSALVFITTVVLTSGAAIWLFIAHDTWIDMVVPNVGLVLLFAQAQTVQYFTEGRQKRQVRSAFQRYLPPSVVNEVLKVPTEQLKLGGDRRELSVFFSDIVSFTNLSENLDAEQLVSMLNVYLSEMSDIVSNSGGTIDKYIGDCIMAFWGAPLPIENNAAQACFAALDCNERLKTLREQFVADGYPEIHARIGINTGDMLVGNVGSDSRFSYTVMGDAVNLASRIEGANKQYGTQLMIGELTYERAQHAIEARALDLIRVKGKAQPVQVYELMSRKGGLDPTREQLRKLYEEGIEFYRMREWSQALDRFRAALALVPEDGPSDTYRLRCEAYVETPPSPDWDGVFTMTTK
jgi:adenylate cyclase